MHADRRPARGRVVIEQFESAALRDNPLGDPHVREIPVYLPPGYDAAPERRYPVTYWLHGFTGIGLSALNRSPWSPSLPEIMDRIVAEGAPPMILVMVDGFTKYGGSQYLNSAANGRYEDYVVQDLVPYVDAKYRTIPRRGARGVNGKSSGGYGALMLAMRHPEVFGAAASHSGDLYFQYCYLPDFPKFLRTVEQHGGVARFLEAFLAMEKKTPEALTAINVAAMALAYSPNPDRPDYPFDLPFDLETGELIEEVWARWEEHDPVYLVARHVDALRSLKLLYFECGTRDEFNLLYGARILAQRLKTLEVPHEYVEFPDGHRDVNYRYAESLRRLARALSNGE